MARIKVIQNTENRDTQIIKSNALIEAKYSLSLGEQRLILLLLGSIGREDQDFRDYFIKVRDFIDMYSLEKSKGSYADFKKAIDALEDRKIEILEGNSWEKFRWFSYAKYVDGSGVVQIRFDPAMKPYLQ
jgi:plasmid replication initiation protein